MIDKVECYAGSTYPEKPRALNWEGQYYQVLEVIYQSREPEGLRFLVKCAPGNMMFDLFYNQLAKEWQIQPRGFIPNQELVQNSPNKTGD